MYFADGLAIARKQEFVVFPDVVVGSDTVDVELQGSQYLSLVNTDMFLQLLHLILIERLHHHRLPRYHIVERVA